MTFGNGKEFTNYEMRPVT